MSVGSPTAGTWFSSQWRPDNEFETDRFPVTQEQSLGWLAHDDAERRDVAQCVTDRHGLEDLGQGEAVWRVQTLNPSRGTDQKPHASERHDDDEDQPDPSDTVEHFADAGAVEKVGEQRDPDDGGQNAA